MHTKKNTVWCAYPFIFICKLVSSGFSHRVFFQSLDIRSRSQFFFISSAEHIDNDRAFSFAQTTLAHAYHFELREEEKIVVINE